MKFDLTEEEANLVLTALSHRPFVEVALLIKKIQQQGLEQMEETKEKQDATN